MGAPGLNRRSIRVAFYTITAAAGAALLYLSLRRIEWSIVWRTLQSIQPLYLTLALLTSVLPLFLRSARWRIMLGALERVSYSTVFWAVAAGYFGNNFLPARGGEVVRSYIIRQRSNLSLSFVLATALSERAADAVALVGLGAAALLFVPRRPAWAGAAFGSFLALGAAGLLGLAFAPLFQRRLEHWLSRFPRARHQLRELLLGVRTFHHAPRLAWFTGLTLGIWFLDAASTTILARALSIDMPLALSTFLIVALSLASALPSTPGYVGVYQYVAVTVLPPFGIPASVALAFILVSQAGGYVVTGITGLLATTWFTPIKLPPSHIRS